MEIEIRKIIYGSSEYDLEVQLRFKVLREPLGRHFLPEELSREVDDIHLGAFSGLNLLGCLFLSPQDSKLIKMRQVAVDFNSQGLGIGRRLIEYAEEKSKQLGYGEIILNARQSAIPFYLKLGYEPYGELIEEVSLPHQKMRKRLL